PGPLGPLATSVIPEAFGLRPEYQAVPARPRESEEVAGRGGLCEGRLRHHHRAASRAPIESRRLPGGDCFGSPRWTRKRSRTAPRSTTTQGGAGRDATDWNPAPHGA